MNASITSHHNSTPFSLLFAKRPNGPFLNNFSLDEPEAAPLDHQYLLKRLEYMTNIVYPQIYQKGMNTKDRENTYFLKQRKILQEKDPFPPGCYVMVLDTLRKDKVTPRCKGPFQIVRKNKGGAYVLAQHDGSHTTRPPNHLKRVGFLDKEVGRVAIVESILDHKRENNIDYYMVKWKDLPSSYNQWVQYQDFHDTTPIVNFWNHKEPNDKKQVLPESTNKRSNPPRNKLLHKQQRIWGAE
jgi:hypothetical protein